MNGKILYPKGNSMTFPLELAQIDEEKEKRADLKYLYPIELASMQKMVSDVCDQMEYDGSMMYDRFPDKVTMERMASSICCQRNQFCDEYSGGNPLLKSLVEVMLCHEMDCRREKRRRHKKQMR